jgi:heme exporter protein B
MVGTDKAKTPVSHGPFSDDETPGMATAPVTGAVSPPTAPFWDQALAVARKDLRTELRSREVVTVILPFGAVALLLIPLAIGTDLPLLERIGTGMYWVIVLLFGVLVSIRRSAHEEPAQADLLMLLGSDPAAVFTGRALATGVLLLAFEVLLAPVALALYDPEIRGWPWLLLLLPLVTAGLAVLGTLAAAVGNSDSASPALVPLLVIPLAIPVLLGATQVVERLVMDQSIIVWVLSLVVMDLALAVAGVLTARPLQEAAQ